MAIDELAGVVLAGGAGRRLGLPKATADLAGSTLVERAVDALSPLCARLVVASREGVALPVVAGDVEVVLDAGGERSAITGLVSGLSALSTSQVLVLACDLVVTSAVLERLIAADGPSAVAMDEDGPQPLCARYDRERALIACRSIADSGDLRARQLVDLLDPMLVRVEPGELININTPADLDRAARLLE